MRITQTLSSRGQDKVDGWCQGNLPKSTSVWWTPSIVQLTDLQTLLLFPDGSCRHTGQYNNAFHPSFPRFSVTSPQSVLEVPHFPSTGKAATKPICEHVIEKQ